MRNTRTGDNDFNLVRRSLREAYKHVAVALEKSTKAKAGDPARLAASATLTQRLERIETKLIEEIEALELVYSDSVASLQSSHLSQ